jgi:RNA polymerase sigma factor FliA
MTPVPSPYAAPASTSADELALWTAYRSSRDPVAREGLIELHLPYARTVAATYYGRRMHDEIEFGDYLQHARIGLLEAMDRYDPSRGAQFRTFAARRMHGAILDGLERATEKQQQIAVRQRLRRERLVAVKGAPGADDGASRASDPDSLFRYLADVGIGLAICRLLDGTGMVDMTSSPDPASPPERHYEGTELVQLRRRILEAIDDLGPQQRTVIRYHYLQEHSFDEVAKLLGVTRGRISQIHRQALTELRMQLGEGPACDIAW